MALSKHSLFALLMFGMVPMLWSKAVNIQQSHRGESDDGGGIIGRPVRIPAKDYRLMFKVETPELGDCALRMENGTIKTCTAKFDGSEVFIPKASTNIDVSSKIQNSDDVITHGMGSVGTNVGVLGVGGVGLKAKVAATIQTSNRHLTLMSSFELQRGILTLQHPHPSTDVSKDGELYLSEIEIGGNEILAVTMEFESAEKKAKVESTLTVNVLFVSMTAKLRYILETFKSASKTRVQFKSSWRPDFDNTYLSLDNAIKEVEDKEKMYAEGPEELTELIIQDPRSHNNYYFAAWNKSPFGDKVNDAVMYNDLSILSQQNIETEAVLNRISELSKLSWDSKKLSEMKDLERTVSSIHMKLENGIESYHKLSNDEKNQLKNAYGQNNAPEYYNRQLKRIVGY